MSGSLAWSSGDDLYDLQLAHLHKTNAHPFFTEQEPTALGQVSRGIVTTFQYHAE